MYAAYHCPTCHVGSKTAVSPTDETLECPHCGHVLQVPPKSFDGDKLQRCLVCPSTELFVRKNFPQRLGVSIVVAGLATSCITWHFRMVFATFAVLFATALFDLLLYLLVGNVLECYRCQAQYGGTDGESEHGAFDLEVHEKHRQQKIRMLQSQPLDTKAT
ncbi:MAG: hypothetical protein KDA41_01525 [Planctomycetales bacterium]|nr:hypothetical protein [Planctomycetales bacterium]